MHTVTVRLYYVLVAYLCSTSLTRRSFHSEIRTSDPSNCPKFHPDPIWNDGTLIRFFKDQVEQRLHQQEQDEMSSDLRCRSQCGTVVPTVVRAMNDFNGKRYFSGSDSSETFWRIFKKICTVDYVVVPTPHANVGVNRFKGGVSAHAWSLSPSGVYFFFAMATKIW